MEREKKGGEMSRKEGCKKGGTEVREGEKKELSSKKEKKKRGRGGKNRET